MAPPTQTDPSWLLSTVAQSAAALVAIIGGLLAARLVALASERQGLVRHRDQLDEQASLLRAQIEELGALAKSVARRRWRRRAFDDFARSHGQPSPGDSASTYRPPGSTEEDIALWTTELALETQALFERVEALSELHEITMRVEVLVERGFDPAGHNPDLVEAVLEQIAEDRRTRLSTNPAFMVTPPRVPRGLMASVGTDRELDAQHRRLEETDDLRAKLRATRAESDLVSRQLVLVVSPEGVTWGLRALVAFSILGIAFPVVLLAWRPVPSGAWIRGAVVVAFLVGLAMVLVYIAWQWSALRPKQDAGSGGDSTTAG